MAEQADLNRRTKVEYLSSHDGYRCGYCGKSDSNSSHGMWAYKMTVQDYQDLIDRGWRRSGKYVYKPAMNITCCPLYTIRCEAMEFKLRKSQKKVLKNFNHYINSDEKRSYKHLRNAGESAPQEHGEIQRRAYEAEEMSVVNGDEFDEHHSSGSRSQERSDLSTGGATSASRQDSRDKISSQVSAEIKVPGNQNPRKAKYMRLERWKTKQRSLGKSAVLVSKAPAVKSLEERLGEVKTEPAHRLEVRLVRSSPRSKLFSETFNESYAVYKKYQMCIHKDPPEKPSQSQYTRFLVDSPLQIRLLRTNPISEEFKRTRKESYEVYKKYQMTVHKDPPEDCDEKSYINFLVSSPLMAEGESGEFEGYGSFHQHYLLDGKIIAVGVMDILPRCVSSVYLYYDPDYAFLTLGTYSALREIAFTRALHTKQPNIEYYYMGFYVQSCHKMAYKGRYFPSFLLCPEKYTWHPIEKCAPILRVKKYSRFDDAEAEEVNKVDNIDKMICLTGLMAWRYPDLKSNLSEEKQAKIREYSSLVGQKCIESIILILS